MAHKITSVEEDSAAGMQNYWEQFLDKIEERQDILRFSSVTPILNENKSPDKRSHLDLSVESEAFELISEFTREKSVSLDAVLLTIWHHVLHVFSYSEQTVVGVLDSDLNILPSLVQHSEVIGEAFLDHAKIVERNCRKNQQQQKNLTEATQRKMESIVDNLFLFNVPVDTKSVTNENIPVVFLACCTEDTLTLRLDYKSGLFHDTDVSQLLETFKRILTQVSKVPEINMADIALVSSEERSGIIENCVQVEIPVHKTMATLFEEQATRVPDNIAVIYKKKKLTYRQLEEQANKLAAWILKTLPQGAESIVAICLSPSELMITSILGVWKAGAAYVAIDPAHPLERKAFILEDTKAALILADFNSSINLRGSEGNRTVLNVESLADLEIDLAGTGSIHTSRSSESLSHIVYTSGTTGRPKGVLTLHKGLMSESYDLKRRYDLGSDEVILLMFNYVFNAFSTPLTLALSNGFALLIVQKQMLFEPSSLHDYLRLNKVTHIDATPSHFRVLDASRIPTLRRVAVGGEALPREIYEKVKRAAPQVRFYNVYGNSEGTLAIMTSELREFETAFQRNAVNKQCFVLGSTRKLVPINAVGELFISGAGVARGYLNNTKLTEERFLENPFHAGSKLFKTGDLGRRLPNGSIEFLGRKDLQIKIRGFRVELGEIESAIRGFGGIVQSAVVASNTTNSRDVVLTGFYVTADGTSSDGLRDYLRRVLPDYSVPTRLVQLNEIPLTANGKVDRAMLLLTDKHEPLLKPQRVVEIMDPFARTVGFLWEEILGLPINTIRTEDDFFELGADSLHLMSLAAMMETEFGLTLDPRYIYGHSTLAAFCENLPPSSACLNPNQIH